MEVLTDREAFGLVEFLFSKPLPKAEVVKSIRDNQAIHVQVRKRALALAERFREEQDPKRFNAASRTVLRQQHLASRWYTQAFVQAQAARRLAPKQGAYLNTLGIAQYRLGKYQEAVATLTQSERFHTTQGQGSPPADLAFLTMAYYRLGQMEKAQDYSNRLQETMKKSQWAKEEEARAFLHEAETLLQGSTEEPRK